MFGHLRDLWRKSRDGRFSRRFHTRNLVSHSRRPLRFPCPANEQRFGLLEALEERTPLAIAWANEFSPDAGLDALGADEPLARTIIQRAIDDWNSVVLDFNYDRDNDPATDNTFLLEVFVFPFPNETRGYSMITEIKNGAPTGQLTF